MCPVLCGTALLFSAETGQPALTLAMDSEFLTFTIKRTSFHTTLPELLSLEECLLIFFGAGSAISMSLPILKQNLT